ncbi:hypothetical protein CE167_01200, partial [Bifidobacterium breve]
MRGPAEQLAPSLVLSTNYCCVLSLRALYARPVVVVAALVSGTVFTVEDFGDQSAQSQNDAQPEED